MVLTISKSLFALVLLTGSAFAQKYVPPPPPLTPGPCVPTKKDPCEPPPTTRPPAAAEANPFPGETDPSKPAPASAANPFPGEPDTTKPASPTSTQNPFPGEPEASSSSSSSNSSTTTGADSVPDPDAANPARPLTRTQRRHLAKVEDLDHRELEDLDIAKYYMSTGNFKAAYLRAKDAVTTMPDDPNAYFALAAAAEQMQNKDEAIKQYKTYLDMDPEGIHARAAARALAALAPK